MYVYIWLIHDVIQQKLMQTLNQLLIYSNKKINI